MNERRTFLVTGATGFLGKAVLEHLLRKREELDIDRVYVLIRPRGGERADERFQREIAGSKCFSCLPGTWLKRVVVLEGDLAAPGLGIGPAREELVGRLTHIVHTAASVAFDLPLADAARANITTALNVLELARACRRDGQLARLVCVSTAYVTPHPGPAASIREELAPLPAAAEDLFVSIENGTAREAQLLAQSGHHNTYTLTKSIAEHLLMGRRGTVPLTIIRPSIISASRHYPFPGWIDSTGGFAGFVLLIGLGHLRAVVGHPEARLDLIPVDDVAARIVGACQKTSEDTVIRHVTAGLELSAGIQNCYNEIVDFFRVHRVARWPVARFVGRRGPRFALADALHHRLPILAASVRSPELRRRATRLIARLDYLNRFFPYFTSHSFAFESSLPLDESFDARAYVRTVCRGTYHHLLKRDETEWPLAGRRHAGHGGDLRWAAAQPHGNAWIRFASWLVTKVLRRCVERVTVDVPSFEAARRAMPAGSALVLVPNHRSYLDFVLCSYLAFARPDLGIPIPYIAATIEFSRIPLLGRVLTAMHAFYLRRGTGKEDLELTRRVHELIRQGKTLEFFIEGARSRSREFLPPKRGLLRCLQAAGQVCTLFPIALSYDRVPEEAAFATELAGGPKPGMRLGPLVRWIVAVWRGRINLGRVHIACGEPVILDGQCDVPAISQQVMERLKEATVSTTFHLESYLACHPEDGQDVAGLRRAIEERGGRVLESELQPSPVINPLIARTMRQQFAHLFVAAHEPEFGVSIDQPGARRQAYRAGGKGLGYGD